jgi:hypothetical protein
MPAKSGGEAMTFRHRFAVVVCAAACLQLVIARPAQSENINEFNLPGVQQLSHQASARLLNSISYTFRALAAAEQGDPKGADGMRREALGMLRATHDDFQRIRNEMKAQNIDFSKAPKTLGNAPMEVVFRRRGYNLPKTTAELAEIAIKEIDLYVAAVEALRFDGPANSRPAVLRVNDELHRLMELGVAISTLSDAAA